MNRSLVVGTSGSGTTTFARTIAERLGLPRIELDALNWGPNWTEASDDLFRARVAAEIASAADASLANLRPEDRKG